MNCRQHKRKIIQALLSKSLIVFGWMGVVFAWGFNAGATPFVGYVQEVDVISEQLFVAPRGSEDNPRWFRVGPGDVRIGYKGLLIRAEQVTSDGQAWLEAIWPQQACDIQIARDVNQQLRRDTVDRGRKVYRAVGEYFPDVALYDQAGRLTRPEQFRGHYLVMNFIFTRCRAATMCPAATQRMIRLQQLAAEQAVPLQLISITFDPEYDTPGTLNAYAVDQGIDSANFTLLTGDSRAIKDLLLQVGVLTKTELGTINHTMATLLIDPQGKIVFRKEGTFWEPEEFLRRIAVSAQ